MSFMQPHREIYALQSTVVHALLGLEEGEEAANVCSTRTHLCIASFLPAFRIPPRGPLWDIIRYMHKAENRRMYERERPSVIQRGHGRVRVLRRSILLRVRVPRP